MGNFICFSTKSIMFRCSRIANQSKTWAKRVVQLRSLHSSTILSKNIKQTIPRKDLPPTNDTVPLIEIVDDAKIIATEQLLIDKNEPSGIEENMPAPEGEIPYDNTKTWVDENEELKDEWFAPDVETSIEAHKALMMLLGALGMLGLFGFGLYASKPWTRKDLAVGAIDIPKRFLNGKPIERANYYDD